MATLSPSELADWLEQQQFLTSAQCESVRAMLGNIPDTHSLAKQLVQLDWLTPFQVNQILQGKHEELVLGTYRLRERIGDGAMGHVYKAWKLKLQRVVAIKTIHRDRIDSPNAKKRFDREMKAAQISHPNIALVRDADEDNNRPFLVMDYIDGINLSTLVKQQGAVPITEAAEYVRQAALGLQYAYECGIVHRDIKPANLMVVSGKGSDGKPVVKILDFGLARYKSEQEDGTRLTQVGNLLGTVDYVSPEQAQNASSADIRADIYSLGCTLFYLLTAKPPFAGETVIEKIAPRLTAEAPWVRTVNPDVPPGLEEIVRNMMARLPDDRYQTPIEVAQALAPFTGAAGPTSRVVMAAPIMAEPIETSTAFTGMSASGREAAEVNAKPGGTFSLPNLPTKWWIVGGVGFALLSLVCMGACVSVWFPGKAARNAEIRITDAKLSRPSQSVRPGDRSRVNIYIERVNFEGPVTVSLADLPPGVVAESKVIIPPSDRSGEVSLTVSFGTEPIMTNIRIVAKCEGSSAVGEKLMPFTIEAEKKTKK